MGHRRSSCHPHAAVRAARNRAQSPLIHAADARKCRAALTCARSPHAPAAPRLQSALSVRRRSRRWRCTGRSRRAAYAGPRRHAQALAGASGAAKKWAPGLRAEACALRSLQLLPDGAVSERPSASISTGSYNFCRFAALGTRQPLTQRAGPAPCVESTAAEDAAAAEAALRSGDGIDVDAFLAATPPEAPGAGTADADSDDEPVSDDADTANAANASVLALVALAGTDPATIELWDLASGACFAAWLPGRELTCCTRSAFSRLRSQVGRSSSGGGCRACGDAHGTQAACRTFRRAVRARWVRRRLVRLLFGTVLLLGSDVALLHAHSVRLWDVRAPAAPLLRLSLHKEPVMALAVDSRGRRGASGAADAQVRDSASAQRLHA